MFKLCARILKSIVGDSARETPEEDHDTQRASADATAADWLPPVLGSAEWPLAYMIDRSAVWYLDRR